MRKFLWLFFLIALAARAGAQSNAPIRLALIAENEDASVAGDMLTVEFSKDSQIKLLERNDVDKVYREQSLSAGNRDLLKLGQVLGADGLLLVRKIDSTNRMPALSFGGAMARQKIERVDLHVQLIAVKPGVLLASEQFIGVEDLSEWAAGLATHLKPLIPKLSVLNQEAVPISIVNLRAAMQSPGAEELERQLTALTIERLSRERQLFVLERRKMELLASEKDLKGMDSSAFWNGSYLLDGTLDRNGYSGDTVTISARLVPPNGAAPVPIEISGRRTNLSEVVNQLADKVRESLKLARAAAPWNAADEAQQYFDEAKWALKWNLLPEAQSASESAWALGKQDLECALVRTRAYLAELDSTVVRYQDAVASISFAVDAQGNPRDIPPTEAEIQSEIKEWRRDHPFAIAYEVKRNDTKLEATISMALAESAPSESNIDRALRLLEIYYDFSRTRPEGLPQPGTQAINWKSSKWTDAGIEVLTAASKVLRDFNFVPSSQSNVDSKLAELRALTRTVAAFIAQTPSVREGYFVGARAATHDELSYTLQDYPNIFACEVNWGSFWQEKPEDTLGLYRELMSSAAFCYLHSSFWERKPGQPRLVAWNESDRKRIPELWQNFVAELGGSTNVLWQMEAQALAKTQARTDQESHSAESNWWNIVRSHRAELVAHNVELFHLGWGFSYGQETRDMDREYWMKTVPAVKTTAAYQEQKKYLSEFAPYNSGMFEKIFHEKSYSKAQALELKPLIENYRSNIEAQATDRSSKFNAEGNSRSVKLSLEDRVDAIINAKPEVSPPQPPSIAPLPPSPMKVAPPSNDVISKFDSVTNILVIKNFRPIPKEQLPATNLTQLVVFGHRLRDDKLLLDLRYRDDAREYETNSSREQTRYREAAAILSPDGGWTVTPFPHYEDSIVKARDFLEAEVGLVDVFGPKCYLELFEDALYVSDWDAIRRYDVQQKQWQELPFPGQERAQLYAVNQHLYAASSEGIWEILEGGQGARILASTRRQPAASLLDTRDTFGQPQLFSGADQALCVALGGEVFSWDGHDWKSLFTIDKVRSPEMHQGTAFFRGLPGREALELWRLSPNQNQPVLCLREQEKILPGMFRPPAAPPAAGLPKPLWKSLANFALPTRPMTMSDSVIYFIVDHVEGNQRPPAAAEPVETGVDFANLVCLVPDDPRPFVVPLRFDSTQGPVPNHTGRLRAVTMWMECSADSLFIGAPGLPGVWALSKAEIRSELDRQRKERPANDPSDAAEQASENREKALLAKYDLNHDGQIDPEERAPAVNDPIFLEFAIDQIDLNHNGQLDAEETIYFDVNKNRILEPAEETGIRAVQRILAVRALKAFDTDQSGRLEQQEYWNFTRGKPSSTAAFMAFQSPSHSEVEKLEHFLESATEDSLQRSARPMPGMMEGPFNQRNPDPMRLKRVAQWYWSQQKAPQ